MSKKATIYVRRELQELRAIDSTLDAIIKSFGAYKSGEKVNIFGRDNPYIQPIPYAQRAKLQHAHILDRLNIVEMKRGKSDRALVYTEASMTPNTYYIIEVLAENAHAIARSQEVYRDTGKSFIQWAIEQAENFRERV